MIIAYSITSRIYLFIYFLSPKIYQLPGLPGGLRRPCHTYCFIVHSSQKFSMNSERPKQVNNHDRRYLWLLLVFMMEKYGPTQQ